MEGPHTIERCEEVTGAVLHAVCCALLEQRVVLESMLLEPNMVLPGTGTSHPASVQGVATATLRCFRRHVPVAVPGIVFLSGGQQERLATAHLNAINQLPGANPASATLPNTEGQSRSGRGCAWRSWRSPLHRSW